MFTSCVKVEVAVLGSPSLIVRTGSVDVKRHWTSTELASLSELCESGGGLPGVPNSPYSLCGRKATLNKDAECQRSNARL